MKALYLLPLFASVSVATLRECTVLELIPCAFLIDDDKPATTGSWPETEQEMDIHCERSLKVTKCMHDFAVRCPNGEFAHLSHFLKDKHELLQEVCTKGSSLRRRYLKHAKCINSHHSELVGKCGALMEFEDPNVFKESYCGEHKDMLGCHYEEIEKNCGKPALLLIKEMLQPTNAMMDKVCEGKAVPNNAVLFAFIENAYESPMI